jgi:DNA polymerase-3 subunit gamma/tau
MLSTAAFNALLKTLEEPPAHAIFILATTEVHKIPATVLSRCQRHEFRRIPIQEITAYLRGMANEEKLEVEDGALALIARQSTGCLRDAISLLDQLASGGGAVSLALTQAVLGTAAGQAVILVLEDILKRDSAAGLEHLHQALDGGSDPRQFARQMVDYLRDLLLMRMGNPAQVEATPEQRAQMARHAQALEVGELLRVLRAFNQAAAEGRAAWHPALPLELAFLEAIAGEAAPPEAIAAPAPPAEPAARPRRMEAPEPKPAAPKAADSTPPVDEESSQEFQTIQREWRRITEAMRERDPKAAGLLNSCKPAGMRRGVLLLGCNGPFVKQQLEQPETLGQVRRVIAPVVGREIGVSVFVMGRKGERFPPDLDMEGLVAAALRDLGGEIVDIQ